MKPSSLISFIFLCVVSFGNLTAYAANPNPQDAGETNSEHQINSNFSEEQFDTAFRKLKSQDHLQFELAGAPEQPTFEWLEKLLASIGKILKALSPFLIFFFWGFVILLVALLLYVIVTSIGGFHAARRKAREEDEEAYTYRPTQAQALILLQEVDALAAKGLYAEAVHQLLFRSIQDIGTAKPNMIRRSYTSREIADISSLAPDTRHAFALIAAEVERSYFGGQNLDKPAFEKCRAAYAELARPEQSEDTLPSLNGAMA